MNSSTGRPKTVLVLGGGVGGIVAANHLRKQLAPADRVVLIDRESQHVFQPSLLWLAIGDRSPSDIQRPLTRLVRRGVEVITGDIDAFDPSVGSVRVDGSVHHGDAVIVSLGAELAPEAIPGLAAAGHNLYSVGGATAMRNALARMKSGRVVVLTAAPAYKCPAAPYEAAMLIESALRRQGVRSAVAIDLYAAEPGPMGVAGPAVSLAVRQLVESKGINYHPSHQVTAVDATSRQISFANGASADFDLLIYVPPHRAPAVARDSGLADGSGWIPVNRETFETSFANVYAIGDVTSVPLTMGKPLPKAGVFAHAQAEVVAANIASNWTGSGNVRKFDGHGQCFLEIGDGRAGLGYGDFYGEPVPQIKLKSPSRWWHWSKVLFERRWLRQ
ncbi:MAG: NAD(P)/FAD-dependent oxidoreductase [Gemmatimonadaceae bacterium]